MFSEGCPAPREADGLRGGWGFFFAGGAFSGQDFVFLTEGVKVNTVIQ